MQLTDKDGNVFGIGGLEITTSDGKPKIPVINTDITIGTTVINGGVSGRLLFDDAGVLGETNGVHWDKVNSRMGFGTVTPGYGISHIGTIGVAGIFSQRDFGFGAYAQITQRASYIAYTTDGTTGLAIGATSGAARIQGFNGLPATSDKPIFLQSLGGNVGIGITTDAGFKLDVNGTARVQGNTTVTGTIGIGSGSSFLSLSGAANNNVIQGTQTIEYRSGGGTLNRAYHNFTNSLSFTPTADFIPHVNMAATFAPTSGTGTYAQLYLYPTINQTGGANGITRGLYIQPTLTAAADFRAIETTAGSVIFNGPTTINNRYLYHQGSSSIQYFMTSNAWSGTNTIFFGDDSSSTMGSISYNHQFDSLNISVNSSSRLFIPSTGNILINTTTDAGYKLDVNGTTRLNGNITGVGTLGITIPSVNSLANGSITAVPATWGRPFAVDFTIGAYTLTAMDSQIHFGTRFSGVYFNGSQMYTFGIPTQIWGGPTGPNNCSSLHIGVNSTTEYQVNTNYPSTADNFFYLSTVMVGSNGSIYTPPRANPTRRSFILSALEVIFHSGNTGVERGRIFSSGNWGINTTTDAGFRLDVNGTAAIRGITNIIGGTLRIASTGTLTQPSYITSHSDGGWNFTTYTHERGAGVHYFTSNNGSASIFSASAREGVNINVNSLTTGNPFSISGTVNASSAIARGQLINTTLVAAANNDVLVGLDIASTYTLGAFTGVYGVDLRTKNAGVVIGSGYGYGALYGYANDGIVQIVDGGTSSLSGGTYAAQIWLRPAGNSGGLNSNYWATLEQSTGGLFIQSGRYNSNIVIKTGRAGTSGNIYFNNASSTMAMFFGATANLGIGTTTDAGYKLDVNGASRTLGTHRIWRDNAIAEIKLELYGGQSGWESSIYHNVGTGGSDQRLTFRVSGSTTSADRMSILSSGSVGIGTTTPSSIFDVVVSNGAIPGLRFRGYSDASTSYLLSLGTYTYPDIFQIKSVNGLVSLNNTGLYGLTVGTNNIERMRITSGGNMLIGTTTDSGYKLNVNGGGYFEGNLKVNGTISASIPTPNAYVCNIGLAADQSIVSGSDAQIDFIDIDDTNNWYDPTAKRFTPTIAGYYHVDFTVWFDPATVTTAQYNVQIRKNASTVLIIQQPTINNGTGQSLTGSKLIYFNGTTDYIDFTAYQSTGVNRTLQTGASSSGTYASIFLLAI
jgi:hypothetical protein